MAKDIYLSGKALKKSLDLMRKAPIPFAYALGETPAEDLFTIDKQKNPATLGKQLNAASSGSKFASGMAFLQGKVLIMQMHHDLSGFAPRMTKFLRGEGLNLVIKVQADDGEMEELSSAPVEPEDGDVVAQGYVEGSGEVTVTKDGKISVAADPKAKLADQQKYLRKRAGEIKAGFELLRKQEQRSLMKALAEALSSIEKGEIERAKSRLAKIDAVSKKLSAEKRAAAEDKDLTEAAEKVSSKEDVETIKLQVKNWKSFLDWVKKHGDRVMPIPDTGVVYAGYPEEDLRKWKKFLINENDLKGVWAEIEKVNDGIKEWSGRTTFDKLSDVIKRVGEPLPEIVYTHGNLMGRAKKFQNLDHAVKNLTSREDKFLDRGKHTAVWGELSKLYATNAQGEIAIWEGRLKSGKQVDASRHLISTEVKALMARDDLPEHTRKVVEAIYKRHERYYAERAKRFKDTINNAKAAIEAAAKA
ncbi:MAG: hypothetical protein AAGF13_06870 [Pseudomonadota bacterium]